MGSAIIGVITAAFLTYFALDATEASYQVFLNLFGLAFVLGGTFSATAITFSLPDVSRVFYSFLRALKRRESAPSVTVLELVDVAKRLHQAPHSAGRLARETRHPFIADGLRLIENEFDIEQINHVMATATEERKNAFMREIEVLRTLAKYPPAFGMIGTVLGLVALLHGLGADSSTASIGANMSVALTTTLYGLLIANYVFLPMSDNLLTRLKADQHQRRIITEGIVLMQQREDPVLIEEILNAYLMPGKRVSDKADPTSSTGERARAA